MGQRAGQRARAASGRRDERQERHAVRRPRMDDVARAAGVSTATVDRVLHRRPNVRATTARRVMKAAAALGYLLDGVPADSAHARPARLVFVLPAGTNKVHRMLADAVDYSRNRLLEAGVDCRCEFVKGFSPSILASTLTRLARSADGVAFMAIEHPLVREAVDALAARGIPAITIISDISASKRCAYLGLDNRAAGRTAGWLLGRFVGGRPGKVALVAGSLSYRAHEEREAGFLHVIDEAFPALRVVGLREGHDDPERNYRQTRALLKDFPDLVGIYNAGGASDGVARALREAGRADDVVFIGHGLSPDTRALLIDGTMDAVLTQNMQSAPASCARILANLRAGRPAMADVEPVPITVIVRENLP